MLKVQTFLVCPEASPAGGWDFCPEASPAGGWDSCPEASPAAGWDFSPEASLVWRLGLLAMASLAAETGTFPASLRHQPLLFKMCTSRQVRTRVVSTAAGQPQLADVGEGRWFACLLVPILQAVTPAARELVSGQAQPDPLLFAPERPSCHRAFSHRGWYSSSLLGWVAARTHPAVSTSLLPYLITYLSS